MKLLEKIKKNTGELYNEADKMLKSCEAIQGFLEKPVQISLEAFMWAFSKAFIKALLNVFFIKASIGAFPRGFPEVFYLIESFY